MMIDAHAHISNNDYGNVELYLNQLKETGIEQGIVVPGGMLDVRRMTDYVIGRSQPDNPVPDNAYVHQCCKSKAGILKGFVCIDPHSKDTMAVLEQSYKDGFKGLKFSPMSHQFSFSSKAVSELVAACGNYGYPVYSHVLFSPGASTAKFVALAKQFPKVNFILGHMGFGPADQDGLEAATKMNNFFLETSTGNYLHIKEAVRKAGPEKLMYGSEFPLSHPKAELEKILILNLSGDAQDKVLGKNIQTLLKLESKPNIAAAAPQIETQTASRPIQGYETAYTNKSTSNYGYKR